MPISKAKVVIGTVLVIVGVLLLILEGWMVFTRFSAEIKLYISDPMTYGLGSIIYMIDIILLGIN